ncbi:MAG: polysaccharide biosynthesis/export family protein [Acidobacteriota bacterium]
MKIKENPKKIAKYQPNFIFSCIAVVALVFLVFSAADAQLPKETTQTAVNKNYRIGVGDVLKVLVPKQELLSLDSVRVSNEGTIRLPMIEKEIPAACLTEAELAASITEKYTKYLLNPQVYVAVQEFHSNPVAVIGAVNSPGSFDVQRPTRLLELLALVKGPSEKAGQSIQLFRASDTTQCEANKLLHTETEKDNELVILPLAETLKGNENANPYLLAGDIVTIAEADNPGEVYIVGNVNTAKTIPLKEPVTLSKAVAIAGGISKDGVSEKIKIIRQAPNSLAKTTIIANLKEINKDNEKDIVLQANDIVEVPGPSGTKKVLNDIFKTLIPLGTRTILRF